MRYFSYVRLSLVALASTVAVSYAQAIDAQMMDNQALTRHFRLGQQAMSRQNYEQAESIWRQLLQSDPNNGLVMNELGRTLLLQNKFEAAENVYQTAINTGGENAFNYAGLGDALSQQGKVEAAEDAYRRAIRHEAGYGYAYTQLSEILCRAEQCGDIRTIYRDAVAVAPEFADSLGGVMFNEGRFTEAEVMYETILEMSTPNADTYVKLALSLFRQEKHTAAENALRNSIRLGAAPSHQFPLFDVYRLLGDVLLSQERYSEAEMALRESLRLVPSNASIYDHYKFSVPAYQLLSLALYRQGRSAEAEAAFNEAARISEQRLDTFTQEGQQLQQQIDAASQLIDGLAVPSSPFVPE